LADQNFQGFLPKGAQAFLQNSVHLTNEMPNYFGSLNVSFGSSSRQFEAKKFTHNIWGLQKEKAGP